MLASDRALSLLVAMESALDDNRYEVGPHTQPLPVLQIVFC